MLISTFPPTAAVDESGNQWINRPVRSFPLTEAAFHSFSTLRCGTKGPVKQAKGAVFTHIHRPYYYY